MGFYSGLEKKAVSLAFLDRLSASGGFKAGLKAKNPEKLLTRLTGPHMEETLHSFHQLPPSERALMASHLREKINYKDLGEKSRKFLRRSYSGLKKIVREEAPK